MTLIALLVLGCWLVAVIDLASDTDFWGRTIREAKRRAKELL